MAVPSLPSPTGFVVMVDNNCIYFILVMIIWHRQSLNDVSAWKLQVRSFYIVASAYLSMAVVHTVTTVIGLLVR